MKRERTTSGISPRTKMTRNQVSIMRWRGSTILGWDGSCRLIHGLPTSVIRRAGTVILTETIIRLAFPIPPEWWVATMKAAIAAWTAAVVKTSTRWTVAADGWATAPAAEITPAAITLARITLVALPLMPVRARFATVKATARIRVQATRATKTPINPIPIRIQTLIITRLTV